MAGTCQSDGAIIEKYRDAECKCTSEHCYHRKTCDMSITSRNFKQRYCQMCRLGMYHDAREAKIEEFLQKRFAGGNQVMATGQVFFTSLLTYEYVHVDMCKVFTSRHENAEDAGAEWLKCGVPRLQVAPVTSTVESPAGTQEDMSMGSDTEPLIGIDETVPDDFKNRLAQDMEQLQRNISQIYG